ncbi:MULTISPECIES: hypothetical protein [Burkholderiaceae]|uniref:hypothetical protein n=1 Tax=Burkholderiaceae TaxID=119060 RepID=UPI000784EBE1|nr:MULTISPECIES: hypothetical protein [Burkholderiaceae]
MMQDLLICFPNPVKIANTMSARLEPQLVIRHQSGGWIWSIKLVDIANGQVFKVHSCDTAFQTEAEAVTAGERVLIDISRPGGTPLRNYLALDAPDDGTSASS